jgi:hypothetical protein
MLGVLLTLLAVLVWLSLAASPPSSRLSEQTPSSVAAAVQEDRASCSQLLTIPSVGLVRCVVDGDSRQIDAGFAVRYVPLSSEMTDWLAGHRTSHGGTFGPLAGLQMGALVSWAGVEFSVVEYQLVNRVTPPAAVLGWQQASSPTLVLQTSAYGSMVHVWRAVPVMAPPDTPSVSTDNRPRVARCTRGRVSRVEGSPAEVRRVQRALARRGFDVTESGRWTRRTGDAVLRFRVEEDLGRGRVATVPTLRALKVTCAQRTR